LSVGKSDDAVGSEDDSFPNNISSSKSSRLGVGLYAISSPPADPLIESATYIKLKLLIVLI